MKALLLFFLAAALASALVLVDAAPMPQANKTSKGQGNANADAGGAAAAGAAAAAADAAAAGGAEVKATAQQLSELEIGRLQVAQGISDALTSTNLVIEQSKSRQLTKLAQQARSNLVSATKGVNNIKAAIDKGNVPRRRDQFRVVAGIRGAAQSIGGFMRAAGNTADAQLQLNVNNARTAISNAQGGIQKIIAAMQNAPN